MPPKTRAEIQRAYRQRKSSDETYKRKERERSRLRRLSRTDVQKARDQELSAKRLVNFRNRQEQQNAGEQAPSPYASRRSLTKAVNRADRGLPSSPRRKREVISKLAHKHALDIPEAKLEEVVPKVKDPINDKVISFFIRDDISKCSPGMKESISVVLPNGLLELQQKRYLLYKLREAYSIYKEEGNPNVGFSKFCSLRPPSVVLSGNIPQDMCLCTIHENFFQLLDAISKCTDLPSYSSSWVEQNYYCEGCTEPCSACRDGILLEKYFEDIDPQSTVKYYRWEKSASEGKFFRRVRVEMTLEEAIASFRLIVPFFVKHQNVKRHQHHCYEQDKNNASSKRLVMQVDFAENYRCIEQREIQSAYWGQHQVTLFCSCIWNGSDGPINYVVLSDSNKHDKISALKYICLILDRVDMNDDETELVIWSDGPCSQFKNRFVAKSLSLLAERYGLKKVEWAFFATAHGKGPVDGLGGSAKRLVRRAVMRESVQVRNAKEFASAAEAEIRKVEFLVPEDNFFPEFLNKLDSASPIKEITKCHFFSWNGRLTTRHLK